MFENITQSYDKSDATIEILVLLTVAFILGYLLRYFIGSKYRTRVSELENEMQALRNEQADNALGNRSHQSEDLQAQITKLNSEVSSLRSSNDGLEAQIVTLKSTNGNLQSEIMSLKAAAETNQANASAQPVPLMSATPKDDLKQIEGIGPKIEQLLRDGGINTFSELASAPVNRLKEILHNAGDRYRMHNPGTWPRQAKMAAKGQWIQLVRWQDEMSGGKE